MGASSFQIFVLFIVLTIVSAKKKNSDRISKPHTKWRSVIDCEVCRIAMAWFYKLNDELRADQRSKYGEFEVYNLMHRMCQSESTTGSWIRTLNTLHNQTSNDIVIQLSDSVNAECNRDCKMMTICCKNLFDLKADEIVKFVWQKYKIKMDNA